MTKVVPCLCIVALLTTLITPQCFATPVTKDKTKDNKSEPKFETRVFIKPNCVIRPRVQNANDRNFIGTLLAVFIPILIQKGLGLAAAALKKAGDPETLRDTGRLPTYLYGLPKEPLPAEMRAMWKARTGDDEKPPKLQLNPDFRCVEVVRGTFTKSKADPLTPAGNDEANRTKLRNEDILVDQIAALYEGAVTFADDRTALRYEGQYFQVNRFQGSRSQKEKRGMVISIAIAGAGQKDGEPLLSLALVNLGEVNANTVLTEDDLKTKSTSWLGGLKLSEESLKALETLEFVDPNTGEEKKYLGIMPVNIEAGFTETEDGSKALRFIAEVLEAGAEGAAKAISDEILLDRSKKAEEKADALEKLRQDEESAYAAYLSALAEVAKLENPKPDEHPTQAEIDAKKFDVQRTCRVWSVKYAMLQKLGIEKVRNVDCSN